jgi:hypothetical protein
MLSQQGRWGFHGPLDAEPDGSGAGEAAATGLKLNPGGLLRGEANGYGVHAALRS